MPSVRRLPTRRIAATRLAACLISLALAVGCAACSGGSSHDLALPSTSAPSTPATAPRTSSPVTPTPRPATSTPTSSPAPATSTSAAPKRDPRIPDDVPLTGVNTRPGEKPPVMPAIATHDNSAGARAFGAFFIRTVDWGYATMSSAYMRHYIYAACKWCLQQANGIDKSTRKHDHYVGGRISVHGSHLVNPYPERADATALVHFTLGQLRIYNAAGKRIGTAPQLRSATFEVSLTWMIDHWAVDYLDAWRGK